MVASVEPDLAIVLEGPPADDTPGLSVGNSQGKLGGGVQIRIIDSSMIVNPKLADYVVETAKRHEIPYQLGVRQSGGTDGGAIHQFGRGVPSSCSACRRVTSIAMSQLLTLTTTPQRWI